MGGGAQELTGPDLEKGVAFGDLTSDKPLLGHAHGEAVVLVRKGEGVRAIGASCTHYGGPLAEGLVVDDTIRCPWHHACFDLDTGRAVGAPALADVACWEVARAGDLVQVRAKRTPPRATPKSSPSSVVMVGAGAAAAACAEALRKGGYDGPIAMHGDEDPGPVDRPNLSKDYLAGNAPEEWIPLGTRERYADLRVDLAPSDPIVRIDTSSRQVTTKSGKTIGWGALLYAPGAEPSRLPIEGASLPHVHTLRTLADARAIIDRAKPAKRAVVIGASFIGLEVAASLIARGLEVHVVAPETTPLARVLGDEVGVFIRSVHEAKGTKFHLGTRAKAIRASSVELESGESIVADLVVLGVGVKPRVALAEAAGLTTHDGVVVDATLRTSAPGIWAAGDVARYPDARTGELVRVEHWVVAERHGEAVARAMLGDLAPFTDVPFFWSAHHDVVIAYVGHATSWDRVRIHGSLEKRDAAVAYERAGRIHAVATIGRDAVSLAVEAALERKDFGAVERAVRG